MRDYMLNKNYLALYINSATMQFASALVLTFVGVNLFTQGLPLYLVFIYFGAEFIVRSILSPLSATAVSRLGIKNTIIVSNVLLVLYFLTLSLFSIYPLIGFFSFIFHAASRGLYHPAKHYLQAIFIEKNTRGRFLTLEIAINSISAALAIGFATISVTIWGSFLPVALLVSAMILIASFSLIKLLDSVHSKISLTYGQVMKHVLSRTFRLDAFAFTGFAGSMGFNNVVVALLVFFVVKSLELFGFIIVCVFFIETLLTLLYGKLIDKNRYESNKLASTLQVISFGTFFAAATPLGVTLIKTAYGVVWNAYDSSFTSRFHDKMKKHGFIYACSKEVALCFGTGLYCLTLGSVAYLWNDLVFVVSLLLAALGVLLAWKTFRD